MINNEKTKRNKVIVFLEVFFLVLVIGMITILIIMSIKEVPIYETSSNSADLFQVGAQSQNSPTNTKNTQMEIVDEAQAKSDAVETELQENQQLIQENLETEMNRAENNTYQMVGAKEDSVTLLFGGDILFDDNYSAMMALKKRAGGIADCFSEDLLLEMKQADIFMVNNEFPYTNRGIATENKTFTFRSNTKNAKYLEEMGVDIVTIANNHTYDYGEISLLDTIDTLREYEIPYVGAGKNLEEASKPVYFEINGLTIAVIGTTQMERFPNPDTKGATETTAGVFRCMEIEKLLETIKAAKEKSDFVVVYIHWGTEGQAELDWGQKLQAAKIVEAGADLIVGAHAHVLQEIDYIEQTPVMYGLGNFWFNSKTLDTCLLKVTLDLKGGVECEILPCKQENCKTVLLDGENKNQVLDYLDQLSTGVEITSDGKVY